MNDKPTKENRLKIFNALYLTVVFLLLVASISMSVLDLCGVIDLEDPPFEQIDLTIMVIFWAEYLVRFALARRKGEYFKETFIELLSILPYSAEFAYLHVFRLLRFVRLIKFFHIPESWRPIRAYRRFKYFIREFLRTSGFDYALMAIILLIVTAVFGVELIDSVSYIEALKATAVSCFTFSSGASSSVQIVGYGILAALATLVVWLVVAVALFSRRLARLRRSTKQLFANED